MACFLRVVVSNNYGLKQVCNTALIIAWTENCTANHFTDLNY